MALQTGPFFEEDLRRWLSSSGSPVRIAPERLDIDTLTHDLLAHCDPLLGTEREQEALFSTVLKRVPSQRLVVRSVPAYLKRGARGVRLCRYEEYEHFVPDGLQVPAGFDLALRDVLRWPEWVEMVASATVRVDDLARMNHLDFSAADFNVPAWLVDVFNTHGSVPVGRKWWQRVSVSVDPLVVLRAWSRSEVAARSLDHYLQRNGHLNVPVARPEPGVEDASPFGGLAGSNFPGWEPQR